MISLATIGCLLITRSQMAGANLSASEQALTIYAKQDGRNLIKFAATNCSNRSIQFSFKVSYSYKTLMGDERTDSKTMDGSLGAGQFDNDVGCVMQTNARVHSIMILSVTNP
jgi:hypothetical protein